VRAARRMERNYRGTRKRAVVACQDQVRTKRYRSHSARVVLPVNPFTACVAVLRVPFRENFHVRCPAHADNVVPCCNRGYIAAIQQRRESCRRGAPRVAARKQVCAVVLLSSCRVGQRKRIAKAWGKGVLYRGAACSPLYMQGGSWCAREQVKAHAPARWRMQRSGGGVRLRW